MDYLLWNDLIAKYFFTEEKAGREVLLYVNESLLESLGSEHKVGKADFINALKIGPHGRPVRVFVRKVCKHVLIGVPGNWIILRTLLI